MPTHEIRDLTEFQLTINEKNPLGKYIFYIYQEGTVSLKHLYELISRECPNHKFFTMNMEICDDEFNEKYEIFSYPVFLIIKEDCVLANFSTSTKEGLIKELKRNGVLDEKIEIA
jgi:hypothetical protein